MLVPCLGSHAAAPGSPRAQEPAIILVNAVDQPRAGIVRVSVPFGVGEVLDVRALQAGDRVVPAVPLFRWSDGSVAVAQAHVPAELEPRQRLELTVRATDRPLSSLGPESWPWNGPLPLHTELEDPFGQHYVATLEPVGPLEPQSSPLVRVQRYRGTHRRGSAEFLTTLAWLTTFRGERRAELTLVLDNSALAADAPVFGPVRLRSFALVSDDPRVKFRPRFVSENALQPPSPTATGFHQNLLGPSPQVYLGDRTAKAYRVDLFLDDPSLSAAERAAAAEPTPIFGWPELGCVRRSRAFGAHGGPAPATLDRSRALAQEQRLVSRFGPFAGHGDAEDAAAQGTPRNGPSALHNALRWQSRELLQAAETMLLQHCLRPTPAATPRLPPDMAALRQGLSARCVRRPHGFTALDYEHFSVDLLADYYWLTGDPLALAELDRAGSGLLRLLEGVSGRTSRGEGWCAQAGVLIARATGNAALLEALRQHVRQRVLPGIGTPPACVAVPQAPNEQVFGVGVQFDAPWQMAALVHGLDCLARATDDPEIGSAVVGIARMMAGPGWVEGVGPKSFVAAADASRYTMPVGFGPLEGTAMFELGAFVIAGARATEPADVALFARRAHALARARQAPGDDLAAADRWMQLYLDAQAPK